MLELYVKSTNKAFHRFANCHTLYNRGVLSQDEIKQLGTCKIMSLPTLLFSFPQVRLSTEFFSYFDKEFKGVNRTAFFGEAHNGMDASIRNWIWIDGGARHRSYTFQIQICTTEHMPRCMKKFKGFKA